MKYVINGSFLTERLAGVQRYALEICRCLDKLLIKSNMDVEILVPDEGENQELQMEHENIFSQIKVIHKGVSGGKKWENTEYASYVKKNKARAVSLCNFYPLTMKGGIVCVHDICFKTNPEFFTEPGDWHEIIFRKMMYKRAFKQADKIITVSEFSKKEILENYRLTDKDIIVIGNAWQHYDISDVDESIIETIASANSKNTQLYEQIKNGQFYFYLSSLAPNKNLPWILENAKEHPQDIYVLSGNPLGDKSGITELDNIIYAGYVSDAQARALMKNCRAFLFPSLYEGFGIPPMEALCMGAKVVASDIECLRGVYGDSLYYIDPMNPHVDIDRIIENKVAPAVETLEKYSWQKSAEKLLDIMKELD